MTIGATLMSLKQEARAAHHASEDRGGRGAGWFLLGWLTGLVAIGGGLLALLIGIATVSGKETNVALANAELGWVAVGGGIGLFALDYFLFRLPSIVTSRDKVLTKLRHSERTAYNAYFSALKVELATYGIDTDSIKNRTDYMTDDYEFTAIRNGDPIDVNVREFGNEIVFMLNGERMQKPVSV